eukprot:6014509-Pyramimonas_sp.AAC.1
MVTRSIKRAIIEERKLYRNVCCTSPESADYLIGCPVRRSSRSPDFKGTPWVWTHGDGRVNCADLNATPYEEQLTESDYDHATADEIARPSLRWKNFSPLHPLAHFNRHGRAGKPADPKSEEGDQQ